MLYNRKSNRQNGRVGSRGVRVNVTASDKVAVGMQSSVHEIMFPKKVKKDGVTNLQANELCYSQYIFINGLLGSYSEKILKDINSMRLVCKLFENKDEEIKKEIQSSTK